LSIRDLFSRIFGIFLNTDRNSQELRTLNRKLSRNGIAYYNPRNGKITQFMAESWDSYRMVLESIKPFLDETVGSDNLDQVRKRMIRRLLQSKSISPGDLRFTAICDEIDIEERENQTGFTKMEKLFRFRISAFKGVKVREIQIEFAGLQVLRDCAEFDFHGLLDPFNGKRGFRKSGARPELKRLEDLYYLHSGWQPSQKCLSILRLLISIRGILLEETDNELKNNWQLIEDYNRLTMPTERLANIIRSISGDLEHKLSTVEFADDFIDEFVKKATSLFSRQLRAYRLKIDRKRKDEMLQAVFGNSILDELSGFSQEDERILSHRFQLQLHSVEALRVLKTFSNRFIGSDIQPVLNKFRRVVTFLNGETYEKFNEAVKTASLLPLDVKSLEGDLENRRSRTFGVWIESDPVAGMDEITIRTARKELERINNDADFIVQNCFTSFTEVVQIYDSVNGDLRMKDGLVIENGRYLLQQESDLLNETNEAVQRISEFLKLLGSFTISKIALKTAAAGQQNIQD
jgi:hypothetical protein